MVLVWDNRAKTCIKPNMQTRIAHVRAGGRQAETHVLKFWREQAQLGFPSFCSELMTIRALSGHNGSFSANLVHVFQCLAVNIESPIKPMMMCLMLETVRKALKE